MHVIISSVGWQFKLASLNGIVVYQNCPEDHIEKGRHLEQLLHKAGEALNLKSSSFSFNTIDYLDHITRPGRLGLAKKITNDVCRHELHTTQP